MGAKERFITSSICLLATLVAVLPANAVRHGGTYRHRRGHVRRVAWNPVLRGSHDSMLRQNEEIDRLQLPRIADDQQLLELERTQELVPIQEGPMLRVSPAIKADKRYARPWVNLFLQDMSVAFYKEFRQPLQVNSAVRTMEQQHRLRRSNRNAAPENGDNASSHLAGITVDLAKRGLTRSEHKWVEDYLKNLRDQSLIEVAEERHQACFHVMVSDRYTEWREANQAADKIAAE
ncbi:MAG TPA: DUF5715 family protein [Candidatus Limnocylindrales bacterium]|nr:DUF5715 family protein [Candidatus Limnocylindrales bacterium]